MNILFATALACTFARTFLHNHPVPLISPQGKPLPAFEYTYPAAKTSVVSLFLSLKDKEKKIRIRQILRKGKNSWKKEVAHLVEEFLYAQSRDRCP